MCKDIICSSQFQDYDCKTCHVKNHIDFKSSNIVYGVFCKKCNKNAYVGKTGLALFISKACLKFIPDRRESNDPVAKHFFTNAHTIDDYSALGMAKCTKMKFTENLTKI